MKEHPMLFSGPMVRAILEGRKTMTRRVVKDNALELGTNWIWNPNENRHLCPYSIGDRLYVRETFCKCNNTDGGACTCYRADDDTCDAAKWTPSIHMPRDVSRITLEVTAVKVERLQDISNEESRSEGVESDDISRIGIPCYSDRQKFAELWNSINAKRPGCSWADNPWIFVIEFKRVA